MYAYVYTYTYMYVCTPQPYNKKSQKSGLTQQFLRDSRGCLSQTQEFLKPCSWVPPHLCPKMYFSVKGLVKKSSLLGGVAPAGSRRSVCVIVRG